MHTTTPIQTVCRIGTFDRCGEADDEIGSYYYSNPDGSKYYNNGQGGAFYESSQGDRKEYGNFAEDD